MSPEASAKQLKKTASQEMCIRDRGSCDDYDGDECDTEYHL